MPKTYVYVKGASSSRVGVAELRKGWSLVAAFDSDGHNIYHYVNTMHAAFIARLYELGGLKERNTVADV